MTRSQRPVWLGEDRRRWDHVRIHVQLAQDERIGPNHLAAYVGLALHAELATGTSHPSLATLGGYFGVSDTTMRRAIRDLVDWGYVETNEVVGKATEYRLLPPPTPSTQEGVRDATPSKSGGGTPSKSEGGPLPNPSRDKKQQEQLQPEPIEPDAKNVATASLALDFLGPVFDDFWHAYPRHVSKGQAVKAWDKAIKLAPPEVIITGAERYRDDPNRDPTFTCHPATWLNGQRWLDDPLPSRNGNGHKPTARQRSGDAIDAVFDRLTGGSNGSSGSAGGTRQAGDDLAGAAADGERSRGVVLDAGSRRT